jgi:hypothetical protein
MRSTGSSNTITVQNSRYIMLFSAAKRAKSATRPSKSSDDYLQLFILRILRLMVIV